MPFDIFIIYVTVIKAKGQGAKTVSYKTLRVYPWFRYSEWGLYRLLET